MIVRRGCAVKVRRARRPDLEGHEHVVGGGAAVREVYRSEPQPTLVAVSWSRPLEYADHRSDR